MRNCVLTHRLEHREANLAVDDIASEQASDDERLQISKETCLGLGERAPVLERATAHEDGKSLVKLALPLGEQPVTPVDGRAQSALPFR